MVIGKTLVFVIIGNRKNTIYALQVIQTTCLMVLHALENVSNVWTVFNAFLLCQYVLKELEISSIQSTDCRRAALLLVLLVVASHLTQIIAGSEKSWPDASSITQAGTRGELAYAIGDRGLIKAKSSIWSRL